MNARHVSRNTQPGTTATRLLSAALVAGLVAVLSGIPATAGTSADPEITDAAGDANFINSNGVAPLSEPGPDTRPASLDNSDFRAIWFETAYTTTKVLNGTGQVARVEHQPSALLVHIRTQAAVHPSTPWTNAQYKVQATVPTCQNKVSFELRTFTNAASDAAEIRPVPAGNGSATACGELAAGTIVTSPVKPSFDGAVSTLTFPLAHVTIREFIQVGTSIAQPAAHIVGFVQVGQNPTTTDRTAVGRNFTIGQDVPADIDCSANPSHPECQP
jgi:hypothetical protein